MPTEYPKVVDLGKGLRPDVGDRSFESGLMTDATGVRPGPTGLRYPVSISNPITGTATTVAWPFPQIFRGESATVLLKATAAFTVAESTWTASSITTYDPRASARGAKAITTGGPWHFASFQGCWFATNGVSVVFDVAESKASKVWTSPDVVVGSLARYGDRLALGGLSGAYLATSAWTDLVALWKVDASEGVVTHTTQTFGTNWVLWSTNAGGDIGNPFACLLGALGYNFVYDTLTVTLYSRIEGAIRDLIMSGSLGMVPLETASGILCLKELSGALIAYTGDSIFSLSPGPKGLRSRKIANFGIAGRGAVAGPPSYHICLSTDGVFYRLTPEGIQRLGYEEFTGSVTAASVSSTYDPGEDEVRFSDGTYPFLFNAHGEMTEPIIHATSILRGSAGAISPFSGTAGTFSFSTNPTDLGVRGWKRIQWIEVQSYGASSVTVRLEYRTDNTSAFTSSDWVTLSSDGRCFIGIACNEFKVTIRGTLAAAGVLEKIVVRYQYADSRTVRGPRPG